MSRIHSFSPLYRAPVMCPLNDPSRRGHIVCGTERPAIGFWLFTARHGRLNGGDGGWEHYARPALETGEMCGIRAHRVGARQTLSGLGAIRLLPDHERSWGIDGGPPAWDGCEAGASPR